MSYSSRFFLYAPLVVVALLFAAAGVHWWQDAAHLSARLEALNGREITPGVIFHFASKRISGFPFSLDSELSDVTLAMSTATGTTIWRSEKFALHALTYGRDETILEAGGHQRLSWANKHLDFAVGALRASAIWKSGVLTRFDLDLMGFGSKAFTAQRLQLHARRNGTVADLLAEADGLAVKGCKTPARLQAVSSLNHADALAPLLSGQSAWQDGIAAWRQAGGVIRAAQLSPLAEAAAETLPGIETLARTICP